jgi:hypothetical protein
MSRDPVGEGAGASLLLVVHNDPLGSFDPLGLTEDPPPPSENPPPDTINQGKETLYRLDQVWFLHPPDEGKPCCCEPPASLTKLARTDPVPTYSGKSGTLHLTMDYEITGCWKDVAFIWFSCTRPATSPTTTPLESGRIPTCDRALSCDLTLPTHPNAWTPVITGVRIRYLSCEGGQNGTWVLKWKHKTITYTDAGGHKWERPAP